jgi:hypothetical protein
MQSKEEIKAYFMTKINDFNKELVDIKTDENNMLKIIHFTCKDKTNINNDIWQRCLHEYKTMYPDYKIIIYDDTDIYNIIELFDKKRLEIIKKIRIGAVLADIFRYLILYLRGGYYSDLDCFPVKHIAKISETQYHGDEKQQLYIYKPNNNLINTAWDFYVNPCDNCKTKTNNKQVVCKCLGHKYLKKETNVLLCYEYEKTWHTSLLQDKENKSKWVDNDIGVCQWFMASKPQQYIFLYCYKQCMRNISNLIKLNKNMDDFHHEVINTSGPLFFTKVINHFFKKNPAMKNEISILPSDYFCCGSHNLTPHTNNIFIKHLYTGTWLK